MDKVLTFDDLSLGHGSDGVEDVIPSDRARVSVGESESLFASPSSLASGSTGGDEFSAGVGSLICVEDPKLVCGGVIANSIGRRFCTRFNCTVKAHRTQKVILKADTLHVRGRKDQARLEPNLLISKLPGDVTVESIVIQEKGIGVWAAYFAGLEAKHERDEFLGSSPNMGSLSGWEEVETPSLDHLSQVARDFRTPKKLKLTDLLSVDAETLPMILVKPEELKRFPLPANPNARPDEYAEAQRIGLATVLSEWHRVSENFEVLFEEFKKFGGGETKYREALTKTIMKLQTGVGEANGRAVILSAKLGSDPVASDHGSITVWEAIRKMQKDISALEVSVESGWKEVRETLAVSKGTAAEVKTLGSKVMEMGQRSTNLGLSLQNLGTSYVTVVAQMKASVKALEVKVEGIELELGASTVGSAVPPVQTFGVTWGVQTSNGASEGVGVQKGDFETLRKRVNAIEKEVEGKATLGAGSEDYVGTGGDVGLQIEQILARIDEMESRVSDESIEMDGHVFSSMNDVKLWCVANDVESCGMFWDLFSSLVVMAPKEQTGKDKADETYSSRRTETTTFENDLGASMSHLRPALLFGKKEGTGKLAELQEGFGACETYTRWVGGSEPYKSALTNSLRTYCEGVNGAYPKKIGGGAMARELMLGVRSQWGELMTFIDTFYIELTVVAKFPPSQAWALVGRCVAAVFALMSPYRARVALLVDPRRLEDKAAYIWAVLQCHRVMQKFILLNFRGHPSVVKEMSLFMLTERVDPSEMGALAGRVKKAEDAANRATTALEKHDKAFTTLKRNYDNLTEEVKWLKSNKANK
jgi:hypothetical protein